MALEVRNSSGVWPCVRLDHDVMAHAIFSRGQYACMFDDCYVVSQKYGENVYIIDLKARKILKRLRCDHKEFILDFNYPILVTCKENDGGVKTIRTWDATQTSCVPENTFNFKIAKICSSAIQGKTLALMDNPVNGCCPSVYVVPDIDHPKVLRFCEEVDIDADLDYDGAVQLYENGRHVVFSAFTGCLVMISTDEDPEIACIPPEGASKEEYAEGMEGREEERRTAHIMSSLAIEGDICVGATECFLKVWNLSSKTLEKAILRPPRQQQGKLFAFQNSFVLECCSSLVRIWDISANTVVFETESRPRGYVPHLTFYNDTIFRVHTKDTDPQPFEDVVIRLPKEEQMATLARPQKKECLLM